VELFFGVKERPYEHACKFEGVGSEGFTVGSRSSCGGAIDFAVAVFLKKCECGYPECIVCSGYYYCIYFNNISMYGDIVKWSG